MFIYIDCVPRACSPAMLPISFRHGLAYLLWRSVVQRTSTELHPRELLPYVASKDAVGVSLQAVKQSTAFPDCLAATVWPCCQQREGWGWRGGHWWQHVNRDLEILARINEEQKIVRKSWSNSSKENQGASSALWYHSLDPTSLSVYLACCVLH